MNNKELVEKYDTMAKKLGIQFYEYERNQYPEGMDEVTAKLEVLDMVLKDLGHSGVDWDYRDNSGF